MFKKICLALSVLACSLVAKQVIVFDFGDVVGGFDRAKYESFLAENLSITQEEAAQALKTYRAEVDDKEVPIEEFWKGYTEVYGKDWPADWRQIVSEAGLQALYVSHEVDEIIRSLKLQGYRTALLSNARDYVSEGFRKRGFYEPFDPLLISCQIGVSKPDERAYLILIDALGVEPAECIFIDDKRRNVEAAERLGIDGIVFQSAEQLRRELQSRGVSI